MHRAPPLVTSEWRQVNGALCQNYPVAAVIVRFVFRRFMVLVFTDQRNKMRAGAERADHRLEIQTSIADVDQEKSVIAKHPVIRFESLPSHEMNRNRIGAERIQYQQRIFLCRLTG